MSSFGITDASPWEDQLYAELQDCEGSEHELEALYDGLASDGTPDIRFVAQMLRSDEQMHQDLLRAIRNTILASGGEGTQGPTVPDLPTRRANLAELEGRIKRLVAREREDIKRLQKLERDFRPVRDTTVWPLIAEVIAADAKKHVLMLKFLSGHLKGIFD